MKSRYNYLKSRIQHYRHAALLGFAGRIIMFVLSGVAIGMFTAWYMIEKGSKLSTVHSASWQHWFNSGTVGADPYTLAYMARSGRLPITSTNALYFIAKYDDEGEELTTECDYVISGKPLAADWWSLALYKRDGRSISNENGRTAINSSDILRYSNGSYQVNLSEQVRPGNWLQLKEEDDMVMILRLYGIHVTKETQRSTSIEQNLPTIKRVTCR